MGTDITGHAAGVCRYFKVCNCVQIYQIMLLVGTDIEFCDTNGYRYSRLCGWLVKVEQAMLLIGTDRAYCATNGYSYSRLCYWWVQT